MGCLRQPNAEPIPGYRLIEPLGSGGFGEVWKCEAPGGLFKAIKFVFGNLDSLDVEGARAEQELRALQQIKEVRHPFVLSLDRIEVVNGELVIVMELADRSLHDLLVECQASGLLGLPRNALLRYIRDAAEALDHMNEKHNLQHLDIKPRNLFLVSDRVKVADFGLVKHLELHNSSGLLGGVTPLYAPPETFSGKITERSDQYSLAIVYQELLTGQRPFSGKNARQLAQQHTQEEPELRALPEPERPVVARALAKDPAKRFPNCLAFVRALYLSGGYIKHDSRAGEPTSLTSEQAGTNGHADSPKSLAQTLEDIQLENATDELLNGEPESENNEVSRLGITVAQPQSGSLRPTLLIGVGAFGRKALQELRCRFLDRLGDLGKMPLLRFLYIDADPLAINDAQRGTPELAFSKNEVHHLPLQAVGHYRRRMLDHITEWLPREKLYAIPRSLQTQGTRALGRLAFVDNHLRLLARLRREVQQAAHPDSLYQSVSQTGLALREGVPRVYVIAAGGGGSSGFLVDLGYTLQRLLHQLRYSDAQVGLFLFAGAPGDPATPKTEQANVYATLTELNHYADPAIPFAAQYGVDGPRLVDSGQAFTHTYLLQVKHRSPEGLRDAIAHLGSYLFHELTTPLGARLDRERLLPVPAGATIFRSFGTYAVWFPRGLLLRVAARAACARLIQDWQAENNAANSLDLEAACASALADPGLRSETLASRIEEIGRLELGGTPAETLTGLLSSLGEQVQQPLAQDDPTSWAPQALTRLRELIQPSQPNTTTNGTGDVLGGELRKSRINRALSLAADKLASEWGERLADVAFGMMDCPGQRIALAESALTRLIRFCDESIASHHARWEHQAARVEHAAQQLEGALEACISDASGGRWGFSSLLLLGTRTNRGLRIFIDLLTAFARQCLSGELIAAGQMFWTALKTQLVERLRELIFCRQRLRHLQESLNADDTDIPADSVNTPASQTMSPSPLPSAGAFWDSIRHSATIRAVLPEGQTDLEAAAAHFVADLTPEHMVQLDSTLQHRVLKLLGGLHAACSGSGDLVRGLAMPLLDEAAAYLGELLPVTDVAIVELSEAAASRGEIASRIRHYMELARPLVPARNADQQPAFLLVPPSDAGKQFGEESKRVCPELELVRVPGQTHLMFCREQGSLSMEDFQDLLHACRKAYEESALTPQASPHSRFDISDWLPLDP
jgi:serine/threonine protein kinase